MRIAKIITALSAAAILAAGCQSAEKADMDEQVDKLTEADLSPGLIFGAQLEMLCGQTLTGKVVSDDPQDADWRGKVLTVGPISCGRRDLAFIITAPLAVGEDKSRVWTIKVFEDGFYLSHAHTLKDGSPDPVTGYGGRTASEGTVTRQDFPVDQYSIDVFNANGLEASVTNVWSLEIEPGKLFAYELNREGRHFRAEFDLQ